MPCPYASTLLNAPCRRKLRVAGLDGPRDVCARLCALGILPGVELEIPEAAHGGNVRVRVRQGTLVLGESMASAVCFAESGRFDGKCLEAATPEGKKVEPPCRARRRRLWGKR